MSRYYGVSRGRETGVYRDWNDVVPLVRGFAGARYKRCASEAEARQFAASTPTTSADDCDEPAAKVPRRADDPPQLVLNSDGACPNNGRKGARAGYGVFLAEDDPRNESGRVPGAATSQRAELHALYRALEIGRPHLDRRPSHTLLVRTDSYYTLHSVRNWIAAWRRSGWRTSRNTPVCNTDLLGPIGDFVLDRYPGRVEVRYVPGHSGDPGNSAADALARRAAAIQ